MSRGVSYGEGGAHITISVGRSTTVHDLNADWELTHEMVHFGFPSVNRRHHSIEEGTATYVEPISRAMTGILAGEKVWSEMRRDMLQGLPEAGDQGLDHTDTWGRTYWGGALFCLAADVEIRRRTETRWAFRMRCARSIARAAQSKPNGRLSGPYASAMKRRKEEHRPNPMGKWLSSHLPWI